MVSNHRRLRLAGVALGTTTLFAGLLQVVPVSVPGAAADVGTATLVSATNTGAQGASASHTPALSANGRYAAFISDADLVAPDTNGLPDVYRRDTGDATAASLALVSIRPDGTAAGNASSAAEEVAISDDGSKVVFRSAASDLVAGDTNASVDLFVRDLTTNTTTRVNVPTGAPDNATTVTGPDFFSVSADGNRVAFLAYAGLPNGQGVYFRDVAQNTTTFQVFADGAQIALSGDGTKVAYERVTGLCGASPAYELYVWDTATQVSYWANRGTSSNFCDPAGILGPDAMSYDGNIMAYWSDGDAYGPLVAKPRGVYAFDLVAFKAGNVNNETRRMSETFAGTNANAGSGGTTNDWPKGAVSGDGALVAFTSQATNLDPNAPSGGTMVKNRTSGAIVAASTANLIADTTAKPVANTTLSSDGTIVGFATSSVLLAGDTNSVGDVYESTYTFPGAVAAAPANVSLSVDLNRTGPGFSTLDAADIPVTALPLDALDGVSGAPLRSVDVGSTPLRSVPLRSVPLRSVPLRSVPLRSVTLSELPLHTGTWQAILATLNPNPFVGVPLQAISLDQVLAAFDAQPAASGLDQVTLGNVDLASTPLRSVSLASILLGSIPLRSVPVGGNTATAYADWCTILNGLGFSCADLGLTPESPVLAADLAGVPLRSVPLRSVPLRSVPLRSVDVNSSPLRSVPLRSVNYGGDLGSMPLGAIRNITAAEGLVGDPNPNLLVDCSIAAVSCATGGTLTTATQTGAFREGKTLGDLIDHVADADIAGTLGELIAAVVNTNDYPWESLPLDGLQPYADGAARGTARTVKYTAHFETTGNSAATATVAVDLPPGFEYKQYSTVDNDDSYPEPTTVAGQHVVWTVPVAGGAAYDLIFDAYPGFDLATASTSSITVTIGATALAASAQAPVDVIQDFESVDIPTIGPNTLVVSHIATSGDVDTFQLPVPPKGTRMQIKLGNHSTDADFDVTMINGTTSAPLRSVPLRSVPLRSVPLADNGVDATAAGSALSPETLNDIPNVQGAPLRSVGENRGTSDELIVTVSDAEPLAPNESPQYYTIQVTAYNGGRSDSPYVLYVKQYAPPPAPTCVAPKVYASPADGTVGSAPTVPAGVNTLFLVAQKRLAQTYGATAAGNVLSALGTLAGRADLGVNGVVYPVESNPTVAGALANWDLSPCSPELANAAFNAIGEVVDSVRAGHEATLQNIVVVGGDDIVPMARVADYTQIANESDYAASTLLSTGVKKGTPVAAAEATQNILTDDPLGDFDPIAWLDHELYVPDLAVGRMVETPAEIIGQVNLFMAAGGVLDPKTALTTGYDFLGDGSQAVDAALANRITDPSKRTRLINETWSKADELAALYPAAGSPDIASLNAHYDHTASLPALGNSTADESDLMTTADVASRSSLARRILFTMGCHAGLPMPASYTDTPAKDRDWAQTFSAKAAAIYFANTGFGYGDTATVALSEELMRQFAARLDGSMTVGQAAIYAKQAYFGQLGAYGPYDEKAMQEATLFGLPMWKVGATPVTPPTPTNLTPAIDATGVLSAPVSVSATFQPQTSRGGGTFFRATAPNAVASGLQVTQYRPIEPRLSVDVTPGTGVAHGVLITSLTSHDVLAVPAMARPVIDLTANEPPPPAGDVSFPTTFQNLTTFNTVSGARQHVVFLPGQFFRDGTSPGAGGVQRLFDTIGAEVKYSDSEDFLAPQLTNVEAALSGGNLTISLSAFDEVAGNVRRVVVLIKDQSGIWTRHELVDPGSDATYSATFEVTGTQFEYFAQAQDSNGNVGVTTNKGRYFSGLQGLAGGGTPSLMLDPRQPTGNLGWYKSNVSVSLGGAPGVTYTKSVDGGASSSFTGPVALTADGAHSVRAVGSDGSSAFVVAVIDKTLPTFTATPDRRANANGWYRAPVRVATACADTTSGVQVCPPPKTFSTEGTNQPIGDAFDFAGNSRAGPRFNLDMTPPGVVIGGVVNGADYNGVAPDPICTVTDALSGPAGCTGSIAVGPGAGYYTYTAIGQDRAGNQTTVRAVFKARYLFSGFLQPVNDTAHQVGLTHSIFNAGSNVPLKFKLRKPDGTFVQATGTPTFVTPVRLNAIGPLGPNEETVAGQGTAGPSFVWGATSSQYQYDWKTDKRTGAGYYWRVGAKVDGQTFSVIIGLK